MAFKNIKVLKLVINSLLKKIINFFGFKLVGIKKLVKHNDFDSIIKFILSIVEIKNKYIFFDVGANTGQSIDRFLNFRKNILIYSFEPTPEMFSILKKKYLQKICEKKIFINNFGLGSVPEEREFYTFKYNSINSFIPIEKNSKFEKSRKININQNNSNFQKIIKANVSTLDLYCEKNNIIEIDLLKIDTQGFEPEILKGSQNMLSNQKIKIIEIELILGFAYERNLSFFDIENNLKNYGYKLISISNSGNIISYSNLEVDLIYVRNDIFEKLRTLHQNNSEINNIMKSVNEDHPFSY